MLLHLLFHGLVIFLIILLAFSPLIATMIAGTIANANGCELDKGSVHPCIVNGEDIGQTLYTLGVLGWLALATLPLGLIAIVLYIAAAAIFYLARWLLRRRRETLEAAT